MLECRDLQRFTMPTEDTIWALLQRILDYAEGAAVTTDNALKVGFLNCRASLKRARMTVVTHD